jgi:hypothetical protein
MKIILTLGAIALLRICAFSRVSAQDKVATTQQATDCSVNVSGTNNTVSLTCNKSDENVVREMAAILNLGHANSASLKRILDELDELKQRLPASDIVTVEVGQNGIANGAPNFGTQTVNNFGSPERHLTPEQRAAIASSLQGKACKITMIGALVNVQDAQNYALELRDAFRAGGCEVPEAVVFLASANGTWSGIKVSYNDPAPHENAERIYTPPNSPPGVILNALDSARLGPVMVGSDTSGVKAAVVLAVGAPAK